MKLNLEPGSKYKQLRIYKCSRVELQQLKNQVNDLIDQRLIRPSIIHWFSTVLFMPNKDLKLRMCIGHRSLKKTEKNQDPRPRVDEPWK